MKSAFKIINAVVTCSLAIALPSFAGKPHVVLQRSFDTSPELAFAAEVQAVGPTLKTSVREACLVNAETRSGDTRFYRIILWTLTCRDEGNGKTTITMAPQIHSTAFGDGNAQDTQAQQLWNNIDAFLKAHAGSPASSASAKPNSSPNKTLVGDAELALVKLSSDTSGAELTVDGKYEGSTPSELKLKPGMHTIKISRKGFTSWERSITTQSGESRSLSATLDKEP